MTALTDKYKQNLFIGTSGIVLPGGKASFPEPYKSSSRLHYYSSLFRSIEINSSFHKIPMDRTFEKWASEVPDNFKFTVKLWRGITHNKKLIFDLADINTFMNAADHFGNKMGCLLIQFPGSISNEYVKEVEKILKRLNQLNQQGKWKLAIELRNKTWYNDSFYSLLNKYQSSLVFHDIEKSRTPENNTANDIIYLRFHGPKGDYRGSYSDEILKAYSIKIANWLLSGKEVYVYFNNTMGSAFDNAQLLQRLTEEILLF